MDLFVAGVFTQPGSDFTVGVTPGSGQSDRLGAGRAEAVSVADTPRNDLVVDACTGAIVVGGAVRFMPHSALPSDIPAGLLTLQAVRDMHTGYFWHDFAGAVFADKPCLLSVCTFGLAIVHIQIKFMRENEKAPVWADHSAVLREIALGRATLAALLGKSFASGVEWFPWGVAWSQYDDKSGGVPSIGVRYDLDRQ